MSKKYHGINVEPYFELDLIQHEDEVKEIKCTYDEFEYESPQVRLVSTQCKHKHHHIYQETIPPTCTDIGFDISQCECGDIMYDNPVSALGHDWVFDHCVRCGMPIEAADPTYYTPGLEFSLQEDDTYRVYSSTSLQVNSLIICSEYNGKQVTTVGPLSSVKNVKYIYIPDSVTILNPSAFYSLSNLQKVRLSNFITQIPNSCFSSCTSLREIILPESLVTIEAWAFSQCSALCRINLPSSLEEIGYYAFDNCNSLFEIDNKSSLPITAQSEEYGMIAYWAYYIYNSDYENSRITEENNGIYYTSNDRKELVKIINPCGIFEVSEGTTHIYGFANSPNKGVYRLIVPESYEHFDVQHGSYGGPWKTTCEVCKIGNIPDIWQPGIHYYTENFVSYAKHITTDIDDIRVFGQDDAYYYREDDDILLLGYIGEAQELTVMEGTSKIIEGAFGIINNLISLTLPTSLREIGSFDDSYHTPVFGGCKYLTSLVIPEGVQKIARGVFNNCINLLEITLPTTLTYCGNLFDGDYDVYLQNIYGGIGEYYSVIENVLVENSTHKLIQGSANVGDLTDTSIEIIGASAFWGCKQLPSEILLPSGLTTIEQYAFAYCPYCLIVIPDTLTSCGGGYTLGGYWNSWYYTSNPPEFENMSVYNGVGYVGTSTNPYFMAAVVTSPELETIELHPDCKMSTFFYSGTSNYSNATNIIFPSNFISVSGDGLQMFRQLKEFHVPALQPYITSRTCINPSLEIIDFSTHNGPIALLPVETDNEGGFGQYFSSSVTKLDLTNVTNIPHCMLFKCTQLQYVVIPTSVTFIDITPCFENTMFTETHIPALYAGTREYFESHVTMKFSPSYTKDLSIDKIYWYSETEPTDEGKYWHYVDNEPTIW